MLVPQVGQIVDTINIVPDPLLWEVIKWLKRLDDVSWLWKPVGNSARSFFADFCAGIDASV